MMLRAMSFVHLFQKGYMGGGLGLFVFKQY